MKRWYNNWEAISQIFKFSKDVRTVLYITPTPLKSEINVPSAEQPAQRISQRHSAAKGILSTFEAAKKWTMPIRNWGKVYGELVIIYNG